MQVGREGAVDIKNRHETMSRLHAEVTVDDDGSVFLTDVGSTHGTFVDGERISCSVAVPIGPSTKIKFGKSSRTYRLAKPQRGSAGGPNAAGSAAPPTERHNRTRLEELAKALKFLLRPSSEKRSYEMRPDGYVAVASLVESTAFTNYQYTQDEIVAMASTVAAHLYELAELPGGLYVRLRMESGDVVGPLVEMAIEMEDLPVLYHATMFKHWNQIRSRGLEARLRSPVVFLDHVPQKGETCPGCNGPPQILVEMDVGRPPNPIIPSPLRPNAFAAAGKYTAIHLPKLNPNLGKDARKGSQALCGRKRERGLRGQHARLDPHLVLPLVPQPKE